MVYLYLCHYLYFILPYCNRLGQAENTGQVPSLSHSLLERTPRKKWSSEQILKQVFEIASRPLHPISSGMDAVRAVLPSMDHGPSLFLGGNKKLISRRLLIRLNYFRNGLAPFFVGFLFSAPKNTFVKSFVYFLYDILMFLWTFSKSSHGHCHCHGP